MDIDRLAARMDHLEGRFDAVEKAVDVGFKVISERFDLVDARCARWETSFKSKLNTAFERLLEQIRNSQAELLRAFHTFAIASGARVRRVEQAE